MSNPEIYKYGFGSRPKEIDDEYRKRQWGSSSPQRKVAQQTRRLREKIMKDANNPELEGKLLELVRNPEASALKIEEVIVDMLENETLSHRTKVELIGKMVQAHSAIHGTKSKNVNVNIEMNVEKMIERIREAKKKEQQEQVVVVEEQK